MVLVLILEKTLSIDSFDVGAFLVLVSLELPAYAAKDSPSAFETKHLKSSLTARAFVLIGHSTRTFLEVLCSTDDVSFLILL